MDETQVSPVVVETCHALHHTQCQGEKREESTETEPNSKTSHDKSPMEICLHHSYLISSVQRLLQHPLLSNLLSLQTCDVMCPSALQWAPHLLSLWKVAFVNIVTHVTSVGFQMRTQFHSYGCTLNLYSHQPQLYFLF